MTSNRSPFRILPEMNLQHLRGRVSPARALQPMQDIWQRTKVKGIENANRGRLGAECIMR